MFNPRPTIRVVPICNGENLVIVDDFLLDPHAMVEIAKLNRDKFSDGAHNYFPGPEMPLPVEVSKAFDQFITLHVRDKLGARRSKILASRMSLATLQPDQLQNLQRICHRDTSPTGELETTGAMVLYLFQDPRLGGTNFFTHKRPFDEFNTMMSEASAMDRDAFIERVGAGQGYGTTSDKFFEKAYTAEPKWNRAIFYVGTVLHSADIHAPELLTEDVSTGRLTINAFYKLRLNAG